jgi:4-amino-4-deoxy-L-arabinose transferase-like glycosyltransferase
MASKWSHVGLLLALSSLLFFIGLGTLGLTDRDEGSNAEAAREMVETGNWISPTLNYEPRFAKPVFVYWLMSLAYLLGGVSEFTARLPSAVSGVAVILLLYWFLRRVRGETVAFLGAVMLLLNVEIVAIGRLALTDGVLMFFTTFAVFGFWLGLHGRGAERQFFWLFYAGMALGTLTKGPVGVLIPLFAVVPYLTVTHRWREFWRVGYPVAGTAVFVLLAAPWYIAMLAVHGARYSTSVQGDTVGRFFNVIGGHSGTVFFYLPVLFLGFFPWSGFLPVALYQSYQRWRREAASKSTTEWSVPPALEDHAAGHELDRLAALWLVTGFLFFSLSATRLPHYIAPLFPAAAIVAASFWYRCLTDAETPGVRLGLRILMGLGYLFGFALVIAPWLYSHFLDKIAKEFPMAAEVGPGAAPYVAGLTLLLGMAFVGYYGIALNRRASAFWISGGLIGIVLLIAIQFFVPRLSRYFIEPPQQLAYTAGVNLGAEDQLILYGPPKPSLIFYARRKAIVIRPGEEEQMRKYLIPSKARTMMVLPSRLRSRLPAEAAGYTVILERYGYSLLADKPVIEVPPTGPAAPQTAPSLPAHRPLE